MFARKTLAAAALLAAIAPAYAGDNIDNLIGFNQADFELFSEDLGSALSYKPLTPAESNGVLGFDIGLEMTATKLAHPELYDRATGGDAPELLPVPKLHVHKGLPFGIDVGAFYSQVPSSNVKLMGAELRYALVDGGVAMPAVGLRASYTQLSGVDQLDFNTAGVDISVSKGFAFVTPYAGVGVVRVTSTPNGVPGITKATFNQNKVFAGVNFNFMITNIAIEADRTGDATSYGAKLGFRF